MNNRIIELFKNKGSNILNIYFTAGFPGVNDTVDIIKHLDKAGADLIEIGMPYSDPMADGPTIQESNMKALENGMTLKKLFADIKDIRQHTQIPIMLMGYLNPVMQYGIEKFAKDAAEIGVDGLILPDLPMFEYEHFYKKMFDEHNLSNIFLVTPQTKDDRLDTIDRLSNGFIYVVSTASTTGNASADMSQTESYFERIKNKGFKNPTLIGFNIKDNESFSRACKYANGAIIGSAFIKMLEKSNDLEKDIHDFVGSIRGEVVA